MKNIKIPKTRDSKLTRQVFNQFQEPAEQEVELLTEVKLRLAVVSCPNEVIVLSFVFSN